MEALATAKGAATSDKAGLTRKLEQRELAALTRLDLS